MPLRPVSELGLEDVTDLASAKPDPTDPPRAQAAEPSPSEEPSASGSTKSEGKPPPRPSGPKAAATRSTRKAPARPSSRKAPARPASRRPRAAVAGKDVDPMAGKAVSPKGAESRGASARRRTSRPKSTGQHNGGSPVTANAAREENFAEKRSIPLAARLGISVLSSAIGIAGGVYVVEKILGDRK